MTLLVTSTVDGGAEADLIGGNRDELGEVWRDFGFSAPACTVCCLAIVIYESVVAVTLRSCEYMRYDSLLECSVYQFENLRDNRMREM